MENKIHLLQLIYSFDIEGSGGGLSRFAIALSRALDKSIFDVSICGLWDTGTEREKNRIDGLKDEGIDALTAAKWDESHPVIGKRVVSTRRRGHPTQGSATAPAPPLRGRNCRCRSFG